MSIHQNPFQDQFQGSCSGPRSYGCPFNARVIESLGYDPNTLLAASMEGLPYRKNYNRAGGSFATEEIGQATLETESGPRQLVRKPENVEAEQSNPWGPYRCRDTFDCSGERQCYIWDNDVAGICNESCTSAPFKHPYMHVGPFNVAPPMARYFLDATPTQLADVACQIPKF